MLIDSQLQNIVSRTLEPDERLLWVGRPDPKRVALQAQNIIIFLFGIPWTVSSISFMQRWSEGPWGHDIGSIIFQGSFVLLGFGMLVSPLWSYWEGWRTIYSVTDKRVLIFIRGRSLKVQSYGDIDVNNLERTERTDGTGDLVVAKKQAKDSDGDIRTVDVKLVGVPDVRSVERIIRDTFSQP